MSFLDRLLAHSAPDTPVADEIMNELNPYAVHATERGKAIFVEDVQDPDGRWYRLEYQSDPQGHRAQAYCRYNPWGSNPHTPNQSHLFGDGRICLGTLTFSLEEAVLRARFWCAGYSYLREHGYDATCRVIPEWRG